MNLLSICSKCGSSDLSKTGTRTTKRGRMQKLQCRVCGKISSVPMTASILDQFPLPKSSSGSKASYLSEDEVIRSLAILCLGYSHAEIAEMANHTRSTVSRIQRWLYEHSEALEFSEQITGKLNAIQKSDSWELRLREVCRIHEEEEWRTQWRDCSHSLESGDILDSLNEIGMFVEGAKNQPLKECVHEIRDFIAELIRVGQSRPTVTELRATLKPWRGISKAKLLVKIRDYTSESV